MEGFFIVELKIRMTYKHYLLRNILRHNFHLIKDGVCLGKLQIS